MVGRNVNIYNKAGIIDKLEEGKVIFRVKGKSAQSNAVLIDISDVENDRERIEMGQEMFVEFSQSKQILKPQN